MIESSEYKNKLYYLESPIASNGDKNEIERLRTELGFPPVQDKFSKPAYEFSVEDYIQSKASGQLDKDFCKSRNISQTTLKKYKNKVGLTRQKIKEMITQRKLSS